MSLKNIVEHSRILDSAGVGIFTVDTQWHITFFSREAERITGFSRLEALGKKCWDVFCTEMCNESCHLQQAMNTGQKQVKRRVHFLTRDGRRVPLEVTASLLTDGEGNPAGGVECFTDQVETPPAPSRTRRRAFEDILGTDPKMVRLFETVSLVAPTGASVLLTGETGTGKDMFARAIHSLSKRASGPYVKVNCAALPGNLLESELFGYKKGAFTDARRDKPGMFEQADGGTIFLDEIGETPPELQAKLLQVLEEGTFHPLGSTEPRRVDVRVVSATNADLSARAAAKGFRADLYYRLKVVELNLPPLRERPGDIPLLIDHFTAASAVRYEKPAASLDPEARRILADYAYPGNVRELKHVIEHAVILAESERLGAADLPQYLVRPGSGPLSPPLPAAGTGQKTLFERERDMVLDALADNDWSMHKTADALGVNRTTLWRRMKKYGI